MRFPSLVRIANTPIHVRIVAEDVNEYNERETIVDDDFKCNYQATSKTRYTSDKTTVLVTGVALIGGDIYPAVGELTGGTAEVFGQERVIYQITKARNPDGSVNYTRLDLM